MLGRGKQEHGMHGCSVAMMVLARELASVGEEASRRPAARPREHARRILPDTALVPMVGELSKLEM